MEFIQAGKNDIDELIRMRIDYMIADFGSISEEENAKMRAQLPGYFEKELGENLIVFVAKEGGRIVSTAFLHIIEMPANPFYLNGRKGEVLNVYTEPAYRRQGIARKLMENLVAYGSLNKLDRIDLSATDEGYPIYKTVGFEDKMDRYKSMIYKF